MTAQLVVAGAHHVAWRDADPTVVHLRIFGADGVLYAPADPDALPEAVPPGPGQGPDSPAAGPGDTGLLPVRWAPAPLSLLAWRLRRGPLADDLRRDADVVGLCLGLIAAALLCAFTPLLDWIGALLP